MTDEQYEFLRSLIERESGVPTSWDTEPETVFSPSGTIQLSESGQTDGTFQRVYRRIEPTGDIREDIYAWRSVTVECIYRGKTLGATKNLELLRLRLARASVLEELNEMGLGLTFGGPVRYDAELLDTGVNSLITLELRINYLVKVEDDDRPAATNIETVVPLTGEFEP